MGFLFMFEEKNSSFAFVVLTSSKLHSGLKSFNYMGYRKKRMALCLECWVRVMGALFCAVHLV